MNTRLSQAVTAAIPQRGLLGDTAVRDYTKKLSLFNAFAAPELRRIIADLKLKTGAHVLDAGCGTGETLEWFAEEVGSDGMIVGLDLAAAHAAWARATVPATALVLQADVLHPPLASASFDLIWCVNAIHHLRDPAAGIGSLTRLLRPGGRIVLGQSSFLPDMYFAWDVRLERALTEAVSRYYLDRYAITERDVAGVRSLVGIARRAGLRNVVAKTITIERISPLDSATTEYLLNAIMRGTWGDRLRPYLLPEDYDAVRRLCDPSGEHFALHRPDFHFLQTFTAVIAQIE